MKMLKQFLVEYNIFAPEDEAVRYMGTEDDNALELDNPAPEGMDDEIGVDPEPTLDPEADLMDLPDGTEKYEAYLKKKGILDANGKPIPPPAEELEPEIEGPADPDLAPVEEIPAGGGEVEPQGQLEPIEAQPEEEEDEIEFKF